MIKISIKLDENPTCEAIKISTKTINSINSLIENLKESTSYKKRKKKDNTHDIISLLLESPEGLTPQELLASADTNNLSSIILRIKNILKEDHKYELIKIKHRKSIIYNICRCN